MTEQFEVRRWQLFVHDAVSPTTQEVVSTGWCGYQSGSQIYEVIQEEINNFIVMQFKRMVRGCMDV